MTKRNLIITIILLAVIDALAACWYVSRRIEVSGSSQNFFDQRDTSEVIVEADTVTTSSQTDLFDELQHNTYYYIANTPSISGDNSSRYTSIKHVKVRWPRKINGESEFNELKKELISKAFENSQSKMADARFVYLNKPTFNKPLGEGDYRKMSSAPTIVPVYGNVSQVLVYPYMTSQRLLVMEIDKVEYNGSTTVENNYFVHYDRQRQRILHRIDILTADVDKENKLLKVINKKIDELNKGRGGRTPLQHALNVPAELCCGKKGVLFHYKQGSIADGPITVQIDYDDLEPFFTEEFKQLLKTNEDIKIFDDNIKPEPINPTHQAAKPAVSTAPAKKKSSFKSGSNYNQQNQQKKYNNKYRYKKKRYYSDKKSYSSSSKQEQTTQKQYSGAKRKSGRHGYSGKRNWNRRRR